MSVDEVQELLLQGRAAHRAGEDSVAESFFRRASEIAPDRADVWLELSGVARDVGEKRRCLERAAALDPANEEVKAALSWVRRHEAEMLAEGQVPDAYKATSSVLPAAESPVAEAEEEVLHCARHPDVETTLRCNRCGTPICPRCAVRTPVGFRCPDCVRAQSAVFYSAGWADYVVAASIALVFSAGVGLLAGIVGWFFMVFIAPAAGGLLGEIIFRAVRRRRGRRLWAVAGGAMVVGAVMPLAIIALLAGDIRVLLSPYELLAVGLYLVLGVGAAVARLR
ncbi:MAG: B-box zinc finger protein [Anaerolineae bacterium]|jgi:hypothetical protein|nr:B-box zinc finger protein [Anaerolineae bacterium]